MSYLFNANTKSNVTDSIVLTTKIQNAGTLVSTGNPLPVTLGSENITITGNVNFVENL